MGNAYHTPQCNVVVPLLLWHRRLRHPNHCTLSTILHQFSFPVSQSRTASICSSCYSIKMHRSPFSENSLQRQPPLQILYTDLWEPSPVLSIDNKKYLDQYRKYMWLFTIKSKNITATNVLIPLKINCTYLRIFTFWKTLILFVIFFESNSLTEH